MAELNMGVLADKIREIHELEDKIENMQRDRAVSVVWPDWKMLQMNRYQDELHRLRQVQMVFGRP